MSGWEEGGSANAPNAMSPAQSRAARAMLDWSAGELAAKAGLDERFVRDFEAGYGDPASGPISALYSVLVGAGIVFLDGEAPGVRLSRRGTDEGTRLDQLSSENDW